MAPPAPLIQRTAEPTATTLVPTDIGGLPEDLWHLIGQQPPTPTGERAADPLPASPTPTPAITHQVIQRESESEGTAETAVAPAGEGAEAGSSDDGPEKEEVDIEELSRQVYAELKRRLAADMERERGRYTRHW